MACGRMMQVISQQPSVNGCLWRIRVMQSPRTTSVICTDTAAGDGDLVDYLKAQAIKNPRPFLALLGKILPLQVDANMEADFIVIFGEDDAACL